MSKVWLVTGANSGFGQAITIDLIDGRYFARRGIT